MSRLAHSQSNTNMLACPYMNRFMNNSFSTNNRTFSSVSGFSNPNTYGRTRSLVIKPLSSNQTNNFFTSRNEDKNNNTDHVTTDNKDEDFSISKKLSQLDLNVVQQHDTNTPNNNDTNNDNNEIEVNKIVQQQPESVVASTFLPHHEEDKEKFLPDNIHVSEALLHPIRHSSPILQHHQQVQHHNPYSLPQQLHLAPPPPPPQPAPQPKKLTNPVIALIAHDLLKFMEEENHYRKARENLKSDVEKIRQSRKNSAVRTESMSSSKPRARSSVSAFRNTNTYSRASNSRASNVNYNNQNHYNHNNTTTHNNKNIGHVYNAYSNQNHNVYPQSHGINSSSSRIFSYQNQDRAFSKPKTSNTNYLIDKLIIQVYGQK